MKSLKLYLNVYNFTSANGCLDVIGMGGYHTGIEIKYLIKNSAIRNTVIA